jgi:hypothetical protein
MATIRELMDVTIVNKVDSSPSPKSGKRTTEKTRDSKENETKPSRIPYQAYLKSNPEDEFREMCPDLRTIFVRPCGLRPKARRHVGRTFIFFELAVR